MVIDKVAIMDSAEGQNYNMELFMEYLAYQMANLGSFIGKWTFEEFATIMELRHLKNNSDNSARNFYDTQYLDCYASLMGFEDMDSIPDYCCFLNYCANRSLKPYNLIRKI